MPSRRTHMKSRHGCVECKAKKVKCDERRPSCTRCARLNEKCLYKHALCADQSPGLPSAAQSPTPSPLVFNNSSSVRISKGLLPIPPASPSPSESEQSRNEGVLSPDLELLHQYSTSTYLTLANDKSLENLWQLVIPQEAFSNPFLMHGLLAISAFHLVHLRPAAAEHYTNLAMLHHTAAIGLFRPMLDDIHPENAVPVVAFAGLVVCISFAMSQASHHQPASPSTAMGFVREMVDIFRLVRGVKGVLRNSWSWVENSSVGPLLLLDMGNSADPLGLDAEVAVKSLEARIHVEVETEVLRTEYLDAMQHFRACYPRQYLGLRCQGPILAWPVLVSDGFLSAVVEGKPIALAILGFYGALLHTLKDIWWVGDRGRQLVAAVCELLPPECECMMKWARQRVDFLNNFNQPRSTSEV